MRVQMTQHITGTRDGIEWPLAGGEIELPDHEAADLIGAGLAKEAEGAEPASPEDAAVVDGPDEAPAEGGDGAEPAEGGDGAEPVKPAREARAAKKP